jgi:hypothetical protein
VLCPTIGPFDKGYQTKHTMSLQVTPQTGAKQPPRFKGDFRHTSDFRSRLACRQRYLHCPRLRSQYAHCSRYSRITPTFTLKACFALGLKDETSLCLVFHFSVRCAYVSVPSSRKRASLSFTQALHKEAYPKSWYTRDCLYFPFLSIFSF